MSETLNIKINGRELEIPCGTTFQKIVDKYAGAEKDDIVLCYSGYKLFELFKKVKYDGELRFVSTKQKDGQRAYRRSALLLMQKAFDNMNKRGYFGENSVRNIYEKTEEKILPNIFVMYSLGDGYFCRVNKEIEVTDEFLRDLTEEMTSLVIQNLPIQKKMMNTKDAENTFKKYGMKSKERLLYYRSSSNTNIYEIDGFCDYFYGYMVPSTGYLKYFKLQKFEDGFMILFPDLKENHKVAEFKPSMKLFDVMKQSADWSKLLNIRTVGALNDAVCAGNTTDIILMQEAMMEEKIGHLAQDIAGSPDHKFVMIAGPSSSGKTTFSHRLSIQLLSLGLKPHPLSLDNYYMDHDTMPMGEDGKPDYEALECLDVERFNSDMTSLLNGDEAEIPVFNFKTGRREAEGIPMKLQKNDVLVIEGIHGLNDKLSYSLPKESKFKIYISALTQLAIDEHNPLSTTDGRLIRRIVRDARTRGTGAQETLSRWDSVRRGEEKNIFPFQNSVDAFFNSALIYEMAVLKLYAVPQLYSVPRESEEYAEAKRLLKLLNYFVPIPTEYIAKNSLVREFVGGSCFDV